MAASTPRPDWQLTSVRVYAPAPVASPADAAAGFAAAGVSSPFPRVADRVSRKLAGGLEVRKVSVAPASAAEQPSDMQKLAVMIDGKKFILTYAGAGVFKFDAQGGRPDEHRLVMLGELATALKRACAPPHPLVGRRVELDCPRCLDGLCAGFVHMIIGDSAEVIAVKHRGTGYGVTPLCVPLGDATLAADGGPALKLSAQQATMAHGLSPQEADAIAKSSRQAPKPQAAAAAPKKSGGSKRKAGASA